MDTLIVSSRPELEVCSERLCGKNLRYKDYMAVLAEAGVDPDRLVKDLLLDTDLCCTQEILKSLPLPNPEYEARLDALKRIVLVSPPSYYNQQEEDPRPTYRKKAVKATNKFLGAELYYYLVERGENPTTILENLQITNDADIENILSVTDRPINAFECATCGEHIPHAKFLSHLYKKRQYAEDLLERPDRLRSQCCMENVLNLSLDNNETKAAELKMEALESKFSGIATENVPLEACISCGREEVKNYFEYEWLVHHGIPPVVALNYFALYPLCCRSAMLNPKRIHKESRALTIRRLQQQREVPPEVKVDFNYAKNRISSLSGIV